MDESIEHLTLTDAIAAVSRCSFTTSPEEGEDEREVTHVFAGTIGADWDTADVIDALRVSPDIAWGNHWLWGRCLAFIDNGRVRYCDNVRPLDE